MANDANLSILAKRLGRRYARQRLGIEKDHEDYRGKTYGPYDATLAGILPPPEAKRQAVP
jgi:hypothetical protein